MIRRGPIQWGRIRSKRWDVVLDRPDEGLIIGPMIWREMHGFTADCVLMVLASEHYDEADYIRDYTAFTIEVNSIDS